MEKIAVIGSGSWGSALACLLSEKGHEIALWAYEENVITEIKRTGFNSSYLPDVRFSENIMVTGDLGDAVHDKRIIVNAVPTQHARGVFSKIAGLVPDKAVIVSASKGIEHATLMTVSEILEDITGHEVAVLSGPSFAAEVSKKMPAAVTVASSDRNTGLFIQESFSTDYFRIYTNTDVLGVELGGALKNVMAIASGIVDGLGLGAGARAALITRGLAEMTRMGVAMGANEKTFSGLSGLGDLVLTCTGKLSRNYSVGYKLGQGEKLDDILSSMIMIAEGVATSESAYELSKKHDVEMPIVEQVYSVINKGKKPADAVIELMTRSLKSEY